MKAFIKISKKNVTSEEIDKMKKLLDDAGIKYFIVREIEK